MLLAQWHRARTIIRHTYKFKNRINKILRRSSIQPLLLRRFGSRHCTTMRIVFFVFPPPFGPIPL